MSEEKECNHVDTLGRMKCDRCGLPKEMWHDEQIKSLESRLAEQEKRAFEYHAEWESACLRERGRIEDVKDLESRLTQSQKACSSCDKLQERLSQAEAEKNGLMYGLELLTPEERESKGFWGRAAARAGKENAELKARLSQAEAENKVLRDENIAYNKNYLNLMDVAGKMARALKDISSTEICECENGCERIAKLALASWQDVKEDSRG